MIDHGNQTRRTPTPRGGSRPGAGRRALDQPKEPLLTYSLMLRHRRGLSQQTWTRQSQPRAAQAHRYGTNPCATIINGNRRNRSFAERFAFATRSATSWRQHCRSGSREGNPALWITWCSGLLAAQPRSGETLAFEDWGTFLPVPSTAAALLDRLLHHAIAHSPGRARTNPCGGPRRVRPQFDDPTNSCALLPSAASGRVDECRQSSARLAPRDTNPPIPATRTLRMVCQTVKPDAMDPPIDDSSGAPDSSPRRTRQLLAGRPLDTVGQVREPKAGRRDRGRSSR